jgi:hypothetical protein
MYLSLTLSQIRGRGSECTADDRQVSTKPNFYFDTASDPLHT